MSKSKQTNWTTKRGKQVTPTLLADILCIPRTTLYEMIKRMPTRAKSNLKDAIDFIFQEGRLKKGDEVVSVKKQRDQKLFYEVERAKTLAAKAEFDHAVRTEKYIEKAVVVSRVKEISVDFRTLLFAMPAREANKLLHASTPREVEEILKKALREITKQVDSWPVFPRD